MASRLDQIVKGAPAAAPPIPAAIASTSGVHVPTSAHDPTINLPSSPPQIYLNLLILEASLRSQYLELRARRRQHTFFLLLLGGWIAYFTYALFLAPHVDVNIINELNGLGGETVRKSWRLGSRYWVVGLIERLSWLSGVVTALLVWGTGQWERGVRWPRRWLKTTNKGLRGFNCKVVLVKDSWWREWLRFFAFFLRGGLLDSNGSSIYRIIPPHLANEAGNGGQHVGHRPVSSRGKETHDRLPNILEHPSQGIEEDLSPGGDTIALLLLPKPFSPAFRENWDTYRTSYWEAETTRRRALLKKVTAWEREQRRKVSWWKRLFWPQSTFVAADVEKTGKGHSHSHSKSGHLSVPEMRLRSGSVRSGSHSRTSSRSRTPAGREETEGGERGHSRRSSTASTRSSKPRSPSNLTPNGSVREKEREKGTGVSGRTRDTSVRSNSGRANSDGRPTTPGAESDASVAPYKRRSLLFEGPEGSGKRDSFMSDASTESLRDDIKREQKESIAERVSAKTKVAAKEVEEAAKKKEPKEDGIRP